MSSCLNITKDLFLQRIEEQIKKGNKITEYQINSKYDYEFLEEHFETWDEDNKKLLKESFDTENNIYVKQYSTNHSNHTYVNWGHVFPVDYIERTNEKIEYLKSFYNKIDLIACKINDQKNISSNKDMTNRETVINTDSMKQQQNKIEKIFISHSFRDKKIIDELVEILENIGINREQIFYSSDEDCGVRLGKDIFETIKSELKDNTLVLSILSENFFDSPVCLCEMGAAWVLSNQQIPILIPPFSYSNMKGVLSPTTKGIIINDKEGINLLKKTLLDIFEITHKQEWHNQWEKKRDKILERISQYINKAESNVVIDIPLESKSQEEKKIGAIAKELLLESVNHNSLIQTVQMHGCMYINAGKRGHSLTTPREQALYEEALQELEENQFIQATDYKRSTFKITQQGYNFTDKLNE